MKLKNIFLLTLTFISLTIYSQTLIPPGYVSGTWAASGSPYLIDGSIQVPFQQTLIIEPGVEVRFLGHYQFLINGRLLAEGTVTDSINFTAEDPNVGWWNINFEDLNINSLDSTVLDYCNIRYVRGYHCYISIDNSSKIRISNSLIEQNRGYGAYIASGIHTKHSDPLIQNTTIRDNYADMGGGLYLSSSNPVLKGVSIFRNSAKKGGGIYIHVTDTTPIPQPFFDPVNRCNVYQNFANRGTDFFISDTTVSQPILQLSLDTITAQSQLDYYYEGISIIQLDYNAICFETIDGNVYISPDGSDLNSGLSPSAPLKSIGIGILKIITEESGSNTVVLSEGTYSQSASNQYFPIFGRDNLKISGAGRDLSILDGEGINKLIVITDNEDVSITDLGLQNGYDTIRGGGIEVDAGVVTLNQVKIQDCIARQSGGGMDIKNNSDVTFFHVDISDCHAESSGGGLYAWKSSLYFWDSNISNNGAITEGGGIYLRNSFFSAINTMIHSNGVFSNIDTVSKGGGIYADKSNLDIYKCQISENLSSSGAGIFVRATNLTFDNNIVQQNLSKGLGGGILFDWVQSQAIYQHQISNSIFSGNVAYWGGAIKLQGENNLIVDNCEMYDNHAYRGGAIFTQYGDEDILVDIYQTTIYNNIADFRGGAIYNRSTPMKLNNVTLYGNTAVEGGGILKYENYTLDIINSILWNNSPENAYSTINIEAIFCNIQGVTSTWGSNNIDMDPLFMDPANNDFRLTWSNYPVEDATKSPCIDAGTTYPELLADPDGTMPDMGSQYFHHGTHVCGAVEGTWTADNSPYIVDCSVLISADTSLIIEPGVEILFKDNQAFKVYGKLIANGTESDSIVFTALDSHVGWGGLRFLDTETNGLGNSSLSYCKLQYGVKEDPGGGEDGSGGALYCLNADNLEINHCSFKNNYAYGPGGAIYLQYSNVDISDVSIHYNIASYGGGINCYGSTVFINNADIYNNLAESGGGISIYDCDPHIQHSSIYSNIADKGGAVSIENGDPVFTYNQIYENLADHGGAIYCKDDGDPTFYNNTIVKNEANEYGASIYSIDSDPELRNTIVWGNQGPDEFRIFFSGTIFATYCNIQFPTIDSVWPGTGNVNADPLFMDAANNDFRLTWDGYPMPDESKSPCINTGNPNYTLDPDGTISDMGYAYFEQVYTPLEGGNINGTLNCAQSPYYVKGNVSVASGDELIIEPCVYLIFQDHYKLTVYGRLLAEGNESNQITFAPLDTITGWQGIRFNNTSSNGQDSSRLSHCRFLFGNAYGNYSWDRNGGAVYIINSPDISIHDCLFSKNRAEGAGGAVYCTGNTGPEIKRNIFMDNYAPYGGAFGAQYLSMALEDNIFQDNLAIYGGGLTIESANLVLTANTIRYNRADKKGGGIYFTGNGGTQTFDESNKNNLYLNYAGHSGLDLFWNTTQTTIKNIEVDTFTVMNPNEHFVYPMENFNVNSDHYVIEQTSNDLFVSPEGSDDNSGTNSYDPLKTLHMALMKIEANEMNPRSIFLDAGIYSESETNEVFPINCRSYVSLLGKSNTETMIDGEYQNHIMTCVYDSVFIVDSLNLQNGYANYGGALALIENGSVEFKDIIFQNNFAESGGGAISIDYGYGATFIRVNIKDNSTETDGGGIYSYYSDINMDGCTFHDNFALYSGGAIHLYNNSNSTLDNLTVFNNTAVHGGGINIRYGSGITLANSDFYDNQALSHVMGYFGTGGALYFLGSDPQSENVRIMNNHADSYGGGLYAKTQSYGTFNRCLFSENTAGTGGGIFLSSNANHIFYNSIVSDNTATNGHGGGIYISSSDPSIINTTITGNEVTHGSYSGGGVNINWASDPIIYNSILWDNTPNEIELIFGSPVVEYCNVEGSYAGTGNIDTDPLFVSTNGVYDIGEGSPCIDAGTPDTTGLNIPTMDYAENSRIYNDRIDIGAYEYHGELTYYELDLKLFLEGSFNGTDMNPSTNSGLPLNQPYNIAPWNYSGVESVSSIPPGIVDWVLIEIRSADQPDNATTASITARQAAFLLTNGHVVGMDGTSPLEFIDYSEENDNYFVIKHRNHLGVMGNINFSGGATFHFDITLNDWTIYNSSIGGYKELSTGVWGMVAGNANSDGAIDILDKNVWDSEAGNSQYLNSDLNLDGQINNNDKNDFWYINIGEESQIPE